MPNLIGSSYTHEHSTPPIGFSVEPVVRTHTHKWIIANKVTKTKTHKFDIVLAAETSSHTHKYNIINKIAKTKKHIWDAGGKIKKNRYHKWDIVEKLTDVTRTHKFHIYISVAQTRTHKFNTVGRLSILKTHKWGSAGRIYDDAVKTHLFDILSQRTITKTHKWNVLAPQITSTDIQYYKSTTTNSLGGAIDTGSPITDNVKSNLFDTVTAAESQAGDTEYRCIYVKNISSRSILSNPKVWLVNDSISSYSVIAIGLGTSAVDGTEQTIGTEETVPSGVTFTTLTGLTNALSIGASMSYGSHKAVWIRRVISAGSGYYDADNFSLGFGGDTMADV